MLESHLKYFKGNFSGGLATYVVEKIGIEDESERKLIVLSTMASAMGSLFPSPILGVQIIMECANKLPK